MKVEGLMSKSGRFSKELYPILRKKTEVLGLGASIPRLPKGANRPSSVSVVAKLLPAKRPESSFFRSQSRQDRDRALLTKDKVPSSLQYYSQYSSVHKRSPSYGFGKGRPVLELVVDERELPKWDESGLNTSKCICDIKRQLPRKSQAGRANDHRFACFSTTPPISTKAKRISTPSFSKQQKRPQLFVNCPSLLLSYEPKFSQVELDLGKNGLDMAKNSGRMPLTLSNMTDLQYRRGEGEEKKVRSVYMSKTLSRPALNESDLPAYMRRVPSRLGVTCLIDKAMIMNSSMNVSDEDSSYSDRLA